MIARPDPHEHDARVLAGRLDTGWTVCAQELDPARRERLEAHWINLLHRYEAVCAQTEPCPKQKPDVRFSQQTEG